MATKQQAIDFMTSNYKVEDLGDDLYKLVFVTEDQRDQMVFAEFRDSWLILDSPFANPEDLTPKQALEAAGDWILGVTMSSEIYLVRNVLALENIDESEFRDGLNLVVNIADNIEKKLGVDKF